jgi:rubrerythrin
VDHPGSGPLELAIQGEKTSLERYLELAWQTRDPGAKNMLIRLAMDELSHMKLLEDQRVALQEHGDWSPVRIPESLVERVVPVIADVGQRLRAGSGANALGALQAALELENRARDVYQKLSSEADSAAVVRMFQRLGEMEQAHADLVQAEIDHIENTGFWFSAREFSLESER